MGIPEPVSRVMRGLATDVLLDPFDIGWTAFVAAAEAARAAGFDGVWTWDHVAGQVHQANSVLECWTVLSALAARIPDIAVGPLVLNVANRDPRMLAVMAATLQAVAGGRLLLGLGAGGGRATPYASEQRALGRPVPGDPVRRRHVAEAAEVMRQLWTGQSRTSTSPRSPGSTESGVYPLGSGRGFPRPDPPPPIVIGAFGPKMAELAGRVGDGINTQAWHPRLSELLDIAHSAHARAGKDPARLLVTVFAGLEPRWLDERRPERARLRELGVDRLVLIASPASSAAIADAGRLLGAS
jgi:alkanesulfonate monooxygenase SsuD/methylene tetrahydromethanopterin reductase-like flavin-dependent oxidoreductase (luciferase family)